MGDGIRCLNDPVDLKLWCPTEPGKLTRYTDGEGEPFTVNCCHDANYCTSATNSLTLNNTIFFDLLLLKGFFFSFLLSFISPC